MIYHIVCGDVASGPLAEAISTEPTMEGEIVVMKDVLSVGPLKKEEGQKFSELRSAFLQEVINSEKNLVHVDDLERLLTVGNELSKNENAKIWIWMAPWPADICMYFWAIKYFARYQGRVFVLNIAGLPFLDAEGKIFFPRSIGDILPRELVKARKLARIVTPAEFELDAEEWGRLVEENAPIRTHEGGKKIVSRKEDFYDKDIISFCSLQYQKASRIISQALSKFTLPPGDLYLGWRLRKMAETDKLRLQGDVHKGLKDFEVMLHDGTLPL